MLVQFEFVSRIGIVVDVLWFVDQRPAETDHTGRTVRFITIVEQVLIKCDALTAALLFQRTCLRVDLTVGLKRRHHRGSAFHSLGLRWIWRQWRHIGRIVGQLS